MTTTIPMEEAIDALRERLRGPLLTPGGDGFEEATLLWNGMIDKTPALVVQPTGTADVAAAVDFARDHGLALATRGGGHNLGGTALADSMRDSSFARRMLATDSANAAAIM